jgi:PAS domain S-box-containing protein
MPRGLTPASGDTVLAVSEALQSGQIAIQDFYWHEQNERSYLSVQVPLFDETQANRPLGVLVLRIDPEKYLYPFIHRWPTPSATAETQLVRRDGNEAAFLSDTHLQTNKVRGLRISLKRTDVLAVKAVLGQTGILSGVKDYRGVPVIAAIKVIPDSPWVLVAKIDKAELFAPLRLQLWQLVILMVILIIGSGAGVMLFWRQQHVRFYREKATTAEQLLVSENQYRELFESSGDALFLIVPDTGQITHANTRASVLYGYERAELLAKKNVELSAEPKETMLRMQQVRSDPDLVSYIPLRWHRKKDGTIFPVEITVRTLHRDGQVLLFIACRDITQRTQDEATLKQQAEDLRIRNETLTRFNAVMVGRELRMIELKREVNELRQKLGETPRYKIVDTPEGARSVSEGIRTLDTLDFQENEKLREKVLEMKRFLRTAAHDLLNPLGVIMAYNEFLLDEAGANLSEEQRGYIRASITAAEDIKRKIDGFQDIAVSEPKI